MLTAEGCRARQERFLTRLEEAGLAGALISHSRDIYYFTGILPEGMVYPYPNLLFLGPGKRSWMITGLATGEPVVDEKIAYDIDLLGTINPDNHRRLCELLPRVIDRSWGNSQIGYQGESIPFSVAKTAWEQGGIRQWTDVDPILQALQLHKDPDEIACLRRAIAATLAGYTRAQQVIRPGVNEIEVMTECQAAAQRHSGAVHFYNGDFQSGNFGGLARNRTIEKGELYIVDAWSDVDGYWCDMSRTWSVGGEPTDLQASVYEHIAAILKDVPRAARPGRSTMEFWSELDARVREHPHLADTGLTHHGGHGIGLRVHEVPDLNRDRGGVFAEGNVFTCEPGAYTDELRRGVRLENNFLVTATGVENLSEYPLSVIADPACPVP